MTSRPQIPSLINEKDNVIVSALCEVLSLLRVAQNLKILTNETNCLMYSKSQNYRFYCNPKAAHLLMLIFRGNYVYDETKPPITAACTIMHQNCNIEDTL